MSGLPEGQRGYAWLQGLLGGQGSEARMIKQTLGQQSEGLQDFARQLAMAGSGYSPASKYRGPTDWSGVFGGLGQVAGAGLTAFGMPQAGMPLMARGSGGYGPGGSFNYRDPSTYGAMFGR